MLRQIYYQTRCNTFLCLGKEHETSHTTFVLSTAVFSRNNAVGYAYFLIFCQKHRHPNIRACGGTAQAGDFRPYLRCAPHIRCMIIKNERKAADSLKILTQEPHQFVRDSCYVIMLNMVDFVPVGQQTVAPVQTASATPIRTSSKTSFTSGDTSGGFRMNIP